MQKVSILLLALFLVGVYMGYMDGIEGDEFPGIVERIIVIPPKTGTVKPEVLDQKDRVKALQEAAIARTIMNTRPSTTPEKALAIARAYIEASEKYGIDISVLLSKDYVESRFDPEATSYRNGKPLARGISQIVEETGKYLWKELGWEWQGPTSLYDAEKSVIAGAHYLKELLDRYKGNLQLALTAYNMGPTRVDQILRTKGERGLNLSYYKLVSERLEVQERVVYLSQVSKHLQVYPGGR